MDRPPDSKISRPKRGFYAMCEALGYEPGKMMVLVQVMGTAKGMEYLEHAMKGTGHGDFPNADSRELTQIAIRELAAFMENEKFLMDRAYPKPKAVEMSGPDGGPIPIQEVVRRVVDPRDDADEEG